jgi:hypothetical protein
MLRQQEMRRVLVMPNADVTEAVDDALLVEDAVAGDEIVDQRRVRWSRRGRVWCRGHRRPQHQQNRPLQVVLAFSPEVGADNIG